ncbi:Cyclic nucleotide-binding-like protein [Cynara cardunculus var. scolymus]|uniref:Cyclic nucleotide-binding-like protein n=1 Tax=Cynara cardunculus var. scolymus TaxID=59895 RepID=A0A103YG12_CYNCS|nr:Cyclic nucleotide-binding-like protein [Cynara cardunculus var. scolymus]
MVFVVHGRVNRSQWLNRGMVATSILESGTFFGDELLSWCLRIPFIDRYPAATATFTCVKATEAFALDAKHLSDEIESIRV